MNKKRQKENLFEGKRKQFKNIPSNITNIFYICKYDCYTFYQGSKYSNCHIPPCRLSDWESLHGNIKWKHQRSKEKTWVRNAKCRRGCLWDPKRKSGNEKNIKFKGGGSISKSKETNH